jgi:hypothetical protein
VGAAEYNGNRYHLRLSHAAQTEITSPFEVVAALSSGDLELDICAASGDGVTWKTNLEEASSQGVAASADSWS